MIENLKYKKIKYKGMKFYILENPLRNINGFRVKIDGITFIYINKNMQASKKSKALHRFIKMKKLKRLYMSDLRR